MKFDPSTMTLMTDDGRLIKKLSCHMKMQLDGLKVNDDGHFRCSACAHTVLDTATLTQDDLLDRLAMDPGTCLIVRRGQHNVEII